jgi:hypothetical protein
MIFTLLYDNIIWTRLVHKAEARLKHACFCFMHLFQCEWGLKQKQKHASASACFMFLLRYEYRFNRTTMSNGSTGNPAHKLPGPTKAGVFNLSRSMLLLLHLLQLLFTLKQKHEADVALKHAAGVLLLHEKKTCSFSTGRVWSRNYASANDRRVMYKLSLADCAIHVQF